MSNPIRELLKYDAKRPSMPGEHWIVAATGVRTLLGARHRRSRLGMLIALVSGVMLIARAFSGRDSVPRRLSRLKKGG